MSLPPNGRLSAWLPAWLSACDRAASGLNICAAIVICVIVIAINVDVFSRFLFAVPIRGVVELVALAIPVTIFLSLPQIQRQQRLIRADVIKNRIAAWSFSFSQALNIFFALIAMILTAFIVTAVLPELVHSIKFDIYRGIEGDFVIPVWPVQLVVIAGAGLVFFFEASDALVERISRRTLVLTLVFVLLLMLPWLNVESRHAIGVAAIISMFALIYLGMPVAYALMGSAVLGIATIKGSLTVAIDTLGLVATGAVGSYVFAAVPLFVLLGIVVGAAQIGRDALQSAHWMLGRVLGGLAVSTVVANAIFAAITGISIASAAIFSRIAVPALIEQGYRPRFAVGLVAGSSVLGMLIPPSLLLIIYGLIAEVSINALFTAAIIPGVLLSGAFIALAVFVAFLKPNFAVTEHFNNASVTPIGAKIALLKALPIAALIIVVLGGIYGGVFTPTEAGAVGVLAAIVISIILSRLKPRTLPPLFLEAAQSSASILCLILGASAFSIMLSLSGIPSTLGEVLSQAGMGLVAYTFAYLLVLILLGTVLDSTSILLIMVPLALPTVISLNGDLIWFGIVTVIGVEVGLLTPPLGLSVYTIKSSLEDQSITLSDIFRGAFPFVLIMLVVSALIIVYPSISLSLLK